VTGMVTAELTESILAIYCLTSPGADCLEIGTTDALWNRSRVYSTQDFHAHPQLPLSPLTERT